MLVWLANVDIILYVLMNFIIDIRDIDASYKKKKTNVNIRNTQTLILSSIAY